MTSQPQVSTFTIDKQNERTYLITNLWSSVYIPWKRLGCFHWENWSDTSFDLTVISLFEEWYVIRYISKDQTTNLNFGCIEIYIRIPCLKYALVLILMYSFFLHRIPECILVFYLFLWLMISGDLNEIVCHKKSIVSFLHI